MSRINPIGFVAKLLVPCVLFILACGGEETDPGEVEVGFFENFFVEGEWTPLSEDNSLYVIWGFQGGTWTMPGIRCNGFEEEISVNASITTDEGELIGMTENDPYTLESVTSSTMDVVLQIPIDHVNGDPVDDLYGQGGVFDLTVMDNEGQVVSMSFDIVFVSGTIE
jgi:hypothetical protein